MNILNTTNIISVTHQLLDKIKVKVNIGTLAKHIESHPEYPSLLAICDCLTTFKVDHWVSQAEKDEYGSLNLPFPFITHFSKGNGTFYLVHNINDGQVRLSDEKNKNILLSEKEFIASWNGIILHAKPTEESGEPNFYQYYIGSLLQKITLPLFSFVLFSIIILIFYFNPFNWFILALCLIKLTGAGISTLLLAHSINSNQPLIRSLCGYGEKNNCNAILQSEEAKITSWLSWAEAGFFYFTGSFLVALIFPILAPALFWINITALPFTVYSLIFQYRKKKWCVLCCAVQGLLITEFIVFNLLSADFTLPPDLLFPFMLCFLVPVVTWGLLKPLLLKAASVKTLHKQLDQFKYNSELFTLALTNQPHYELDDELMPVTLGNTDAQTVITIVSSPFCGACSEAHRFLDEWLKQRDDLYIKLILLVGSSDPQVKIAYHAMALGLLEDKNIVMQALTDWYDHNYKTYELWAEKYPVTITEAVKAAYARQEIWAETAEITFTPTVLVNGYKLPAPYQLEDLKHLIN
jgi:protein-disulfide isomerase